jgi:hypothetical protein
MDGLRMSSEEECVMNEEIGIFHNGKRFIPNKKRIVAEREGKHSEMRKETLVQYSRSKGVCAQKKIFVSSVQ